MYLFEIDVFGMDASTVKSLMSNTYIIIKKANCQALTLHSTNLIFAKFYVVLIFFLWNSLSYIPFSFSFFLFFFPGTIVQAPPGGDITDAVSIIGVVPIEISSPKYDGSTDLEKAAR